MTTDQIIDKYVEAHAECRWMDAGYLRDLLNAFVQDLKNAQDITEAAKVLVECVEKYVRQECSRSTLLSMKDKLKELLEK
jgi:hypothetical protein